MCPCGKAVRSRTHIVREREIYQEERDMLRYKEIDECGMEKFDTLDGSEKSIVILGDKTSKYLHIYIDTRNIWKKT